MPEPLLAVRDLGVEFATDDGIAKVLDRVDLSIEPGEVVGLVGESGCGKTTLARSILGILPAPAGRIRSGRIEFEGENLLEKSAGEMDRAIRGRAITFIPQDPYGSFNPLFTVGAQIRELMKWEISGATRIEASAGAEPVATVSVAAGEGTIGSGSASCCASSRSRGRRKRYGSSPTNSAADSASG